MFVLLGPLIGSGCRLAPEQPLQGEVLVFAAASLREALLDLKPRFEQESGLELVLNLAGSNDLARQIAAAPRADVFLSASEQWMDFLAQADLLVPESRQTLLSNRLVVIVAADSELQLQALAELERAEFRHLVLADPQAVPAGIYARQALEQIPAAAGNLWQQLSPRTVPTPDVKAALAMVAAHPDAVGLVYRSDALASAEVRTLFAVPRELTPTIRYSAALIRGRPGDAGARFLAFLTRPEALTVFVAHGFDPKPAESGHG